MKLNEKLAQMESVTKAATPGPWRSTWPDPTPAGDLGPGDLQTVVESTNSALEGEMARQIVGMIAFMDIVVACSDANAEYIATFHPGVAAALVDVAKEASEQPECPFCRLPRGVHRMGPPHDGGPVPCPLGRLTAALGLDRPAEAKAGPRADVPRNFSWIEEAKRRFPWTEKMGQISGFGGEYEAQCRWMLYAGLAWIISRPAPPRFQEGDDLRELGEIVGEASPGCTGAMHFAVMNICLFVAAHGWGAFVAEKERAAEEEKRRGE